ncbi:Dyp-type peroxidase [Nocardioides jishulii]|uniref:Dyp-type peroxidase n=1 Tax=Nocardioides jishulii TaxID=2575440 RepID=A0A4U2YIL3_9ACTN|nr:Dyp-type peroxidase [Nocardioides jishulii]QCX28225.1 Dyp-type peroxidase [Nocardioides jishulii]TKI60889.1 Dyp-type peroxidase [Nocardioides jishulii]
MTAPMGRRGFLGYVGTAAAGTVVGAGAGVAGARALDEPEPTRAGTRRTGESLSPWGAHQPGIAAHPGAVTELVALDLHPDLHRAGDVDAVARLMRVWTADVEALAAGRGTPGDTAPWLASANADLTVTVGLGPRLFSPPWGLEAPRGFGRVPAMKHDRLAKEWSGGDLVAVVSGRDGTTVGHAVRRLVADAGPFASLRWRQTGSWNPHDPLGRPHTGRNLFGQVDGSANPKPGTDLFDQTVWVKEGAWAGGTSLVVRRIRMDLPTWDELTRSEQERSVGRDLAVGAPLTGGGELDDVDLGAREEGRFVIAENSHVRRSHPSTNGGRRIFRKGANYEAYVDGRAEAGLLFQSYQADLADQFVPIQRTLDTADELNEWTTAIGSAEFAVLPGFTEGEWLGQSVLS